MEEFLQSTLTDWAEDFIKNRAAELRNKKATATGTLTDSMRIESNRQALGEAAAVSVIFQDYGRILDMRRINPHEPGEDMIDNLIEWVRAKGVEKFARGFQRRRGYLPRSNEKLMQQIAWGIARKRGGGKNKRKVWWNKSKSAAVTDLYNAVAEGLLNVTAEEMKETLKQ